MSLSNVLIVEDEPILQLVLEATLQGAGYQTITACTAGEAWALLESHTRPFEVILLDRNLPDMDGLKLLARIKADPLLMRIPVIFQTGMSAPDDVRAGLQAGACYYLTKPVDSIALLAIVRIACSDYRDYVLLQQEVKRADTVMSQMTSAKFYFRTRQQARDITIWLSRACPNAQNVVLGLSELMLNAVEHGNLGISYDEKSQLLLEGRLEEEIDLRLSLPRYADRQALVSFERTRDEICFLILDQGSGFDWRDYLEMSSTRAFDTHGRGIAMARKLSFDRLEYRGTGSEVMASIQL